MQSFLPIILIPPDPILKDSFLRALRDFHAEGKPWWLEVNYDSLAQDFQAYVDRLHQAAFLRTATLVPETVLWAVGGGEYVGRISIRHELNENLRIMGGHIGYDTAPAFRQRGIASQMLQQALPIAKSLGLDEVLITCDDTNQASIKVIEKNGGVLTEKRELAKDAPLKRYYWLKLAR